MQPLQIFYNNEGEREAVRAFLVEQLRELAADLALEGISVDGIKDAHTCITRSFDKLDELYGKIEIIKDQNSR